MGGLQAKSINTFKSPKLLFFHDVILADSPG